MIRSGLWFFFRGLKPYFKKYPWHTLSVVAVSSSDAIVIFYAVLTYKYIINALINHHTEEVIFLLFLLSVVFVGVFLGFIITDRLVASLCKKIQTDIRDDVFKKLYTISYQVLNNYKQNQLLTLFTSDLYKIEYTLMHSVQPLISRLFVLLGGFALLCILSWEIGLIALIVFPVMIYFFHYYSKKSEITLQLFEKYSEKLQRAVNENVKSNHLVRVFDLVSYNQLKYKKIIEKILQQQYKKKFYIARSITFSKILFYLLILAVSVCAVYFIVHKQLDLGTYVASLTIIGVLGNAIFKTMIYISDMYSVSPSVNNLMHFLNQQQQKNVSTEDAGNTAIDKTNLTIEFDKVGFHYADNKMVLQDISFTVNHGQSLGIVGSSGAGKSSLLLLLLNLYQPINGKILINHTELSQIDSRLLHQLISFVPQDPSLFDGTVFENIQLGCLHATEQQVVDVATLVNIHDFIVALPDGYETQVTSDLRQFSDSQKQLIVIARALLSNAPILILDEMASVLDSVNEALIKNVIKQLHGNKTLIYVSHRLDALKDMDHILVLKQGTIVESGTHDELIALKNGMYSRLWKIENSFNISDDSTQVTLKAAYLKRIPLFSIFSDEKIKRIASSFNIYRVESNMVLFNEGELSDKFYVIVKGSVEVRKKAWIQNPESHSESTVLSDGDFFGEIALLTNMRRTATIRTITPCLILTLHQDQFQKIIAADQQLLDVFFQKIRERDFL